MKAEGDKPQTTCVTSKQPDLRFHSLNLIHPNSHLSFLGKEGREREEVSALEEFFTRTLFLLRNFDVQIS